MRKTVLLSTLTAGLLMALSLANAYCPERTKCQVQESEAWAQQQNDQQNLRTLMEDQRLQQLQQYYGQQEWQQQRPNPNIDPYAYR